MNAVEARARLKVVHFFEDPWLVLWSRCPMPCEFSQAPITSTDGGETWELEGDDEWRTVSSCPYCGVALTPELAAAAEFSDSAKAFFARVDAG